MKCCRPRNPRRRRSDGAGLAARGVEALGLGVGLAHVTALLGLAVVAVALAVVDLGCLVGPHLASAAARSGCSGGRRGGLGGDGRGGGVAGVAGAAGLAATAGAAGAAGLAGVAATAGVPADAALSTPPWPRQAPRRVVPSNGVPSLQTAFTVAAASGTAGAGAFCAKAAPASRVLMATRTGANFMVIHLGRNAWKHMLVLRNAACRMTARGYQL